MIAEKRRKEEALGRELRLGSSRFLTQRRAIVLLSPTAAGSMSLISLYQMGIIRHLPEPPLPMLDSDKVDASAEAYSRFSTRDGILGLGNYVMTVGLAAMGGQDRAEKQPWIPLALMIKVVFDTSQAVRLFLDQKNKYKSFRFWCLLAAGTTMGTIPLDIPETITALRHLLHRLGRKGSIAHA